MRAGVVAILLSLGAACPAPALADGPARARIAEAALREARALIAGELFGHYDLTALAVLAVHDAPGRIDPRRDHGLATVTLTFSTRRNASRHASLNPAMFEPGHAMCQGTLYLHCGVPVGHGFDGTLELLLAVDREGAWRAVSPHWRSRREYPLHGYLVLDGREKEGYVLFPRPGER